MRLRLPLATLGAMALMDPPTRGGLPLWADVTSACPTRGRLAYSRHIVIVLVYYCLITVRDGVSQLGLLHLATASCQRGDATPTAAGHAWCHGVDGPAYARRVALVGGRHVCLPYARAAGLLEAYRDRPVRVSRTMISRRSAASGMLAIERVIGSIVPA